MGRPGPQTQAKRQREQAKREDDLLDWTGNTIADQFAGKAADINRYPLHIEQGYLRRFEVATELLHLAIAMLHR